MMREKRVEIIFILVLLISQSSGQKFTFGTCPTVTSVAGLTIDLIATTWREYARTPSVHTHSWQCTTYTIVAVNPTISYSLTIQGQNKVTQQTFTVTGTITAGGNAAAAATATTTFLTFQVPSYYYTKTANYFIIAGVDSAYLVLYSCENVLFGKVESVIILTTAAATSAQIQTALTAVSNIGYPLHALRRGYQGCID